MDFGPGEVVHEVQELGVEECGCHGLDGRGGEAVAPDVVEENFGVSRRKGEDFLG